VIPVPRFAYGPHEQGVAGHRGKLARVDTESDARARGGSRNGEWWLRALAVLTNPVSTFLALRDDSKEAEEAREEPVLAIVILAGMAAILGTPGYVGNLLDDPERDALVVAVLVFLTGALYGAATYWVGGGALALGLRAAGGESTYRHARHILAFAAVPAALSLVLVWPVALAAYGGDLFREGGADEEGVATWLLPLAQAAFFAWSFVVLVVGVRTVHDWPIVRALGAIALAVLALLGLGLVFSVL